MDTTKMRTRNIDGFTSGHLGSINNRGITWEYSDREKYSGLSITAENKRSLLNKYIDDFMLSSKERLDSGEISKSDLLVEADKFARDYVNFYRKMERKFFKGHSFMQWRGKREKVTTLEYLSRMQNFMNQLEEKYKNESLTNNLNEEE